MKTEHSCGQQFALAMTVCFHQLHPLHTEQMDMRSGMEEDTEGKQEEEREKEGKERAGGSIGEIRGGRLGHGKMEGREV